VVASGPLPIADSGVSPDSLDKHIWSLTRDRSIATCWQRPDSAGIELRVEVDGHVRHRRVVTSRANALSDSLRWRALMVARGWARA
jgi:hypothetical protein